MVKINIAGDASDELKDKVHMLILNGLGNFVEQYVEPVTISVRKTRNKNKVEDKNEHAVAS